MGLASSVAVVPKCENKLSEPDRHCSGGSNTGISNGTMLQQQYTEMFSAAPSCTAPVFNGYAEFSSANSHNWQSMEASAPTMNTTRQSRSRHRSQIDFRLNNSFADSAMVANVADTRINDIRRVEENLQMESRMLSENDNIPMVRCSTPSPAYCFHCDHDHRERCCLYVGDKPEDGPHYSRWKRDLENLTMRPQYVPKIPEAVSGNSTPFWFPAYTYTEPEAIKRKMLEKHPPLPSVWMRQYYYPIVGYGHEHQLLNQATVEPLTPYQQYVQQHRELIRMFDQQEQQQQHHQQYREHLTRRPGLKYDAVGTTAAAPPMTPSIQQFHAHHVHNVQVAGDYMQQMHQSPYYYQNGHYPGQHPPQQQFVPASYSTTTSGAVPMYRDAYFHPAHYPISYTSMPALPTSKPTPPAPATSTPLWLLFCQKFTRKFPDRSKKLSPAKGCSPGKDFVYHHVRHSPTAIVQAPVLSSATPEYHPPMYATIDHPQLNPQFHQCMPVPQSYPRVTVNAGHYSTMEQTTATHQPHDHPYNSQAPMNDIGLYYVTSTAVNM